MARLLREILQCFKDGLVVKYYLAYIKDVLNFPEGGEWS